MFKDMEKAIMPLLQNLVTVTTIIQNIAVIVGIIFVWLQWNVAKRQEKRLKKERLGEIADEIMFVTGYYESLLGVKGYVPRKTPISLEGQDPLRTREIVLERLMRDVS